MPGDPRTEPLRRGAGADATNAWEGRIVSLEFRGASLRAVVDVAGTTLDVRVSESSDLQVGSAVVVACDPDRCVVVAESELSQHR